MANLFTLTTGSIAFTYGYAKQTVKTTNNYINRFEDGSLVSKLANNDAKTNIIFGSDVSIKHTDKLDELADIAADYINDGLISVGIKSSPAELAQEELDALTGPAKSYATKLANLKLDPIAILAKVKAKFA